MARSHSTIENIASGHGYLQAWSPNQKRESPNPPCAASQEPHPARSARCITNEALSKASPVKFRAWWSCHGRTRKNAPSALIRAINNLIAPDCASIQKIYVLSLIIAINQCTIISILQCQYSRCACPPRTPGRPRITKTAVPKMTSRPQP
jgi:hypothetical protein